MPGEGIRSTGYKAQHTIALKKKKKRNRPGDAKSRSPHSRLRASNHTGIYGHSRPLRGRLTRCECGEGGLQRGSNEMDQLSSASGNGQPRCATLALERGFSGKTDIDPGSNQIGLRGLSLFWRPSMMEITASRPFRVLGSAGNRRGCRDLSSTRSIVPATRLSGHSTLALLSLSLSLSYSPREKRLLK